MKAAAMALMAALAGVLAPACADNESSLYIIGCLVPDEQCVVEPSTDSLVSQRGTLDVAYRGSGYRCHLLMGNQLAPLGNDSLRTETSRMHIESFDVRILRRAADGTEVEEEVFSAPAAGFIDPGQAPSAGYGGVDALLLDPATATRLAQPTDGFLNELVAEVTARGRTLGGTEVESAPWRYAITVCDGCTCGAACGPDEMDAKADCQFGLDGHCQFIDSACHVQ
jgi:hypothetical protein